MMRFSLKTLLLLPMLASIPMLCLANRLYQQRGQMAAARALETFGAVIATGRCSDGLSYPLVKRILGNDFFEYPADAFIFAKTFGKPELGQLGSLVDLEVLWLDGCGTTTETCATVGHLRNLFELSLRDTPTEDAHLARLIVLPELYELDLSQTLVTDAAIEYLRQMRSLHLLCVGQTRITEQGLKDLQAALPDCDIRLRIHKGITQ